MINGADRSVSPISGQHITFYFSLTERVNVYTDQAEELRKPQRQTTIEEEWQKTNRQKQTKREYGRSFNRTKSVRKSRSVLMTDEGVYINNGEWSGIEFYLFRTARSPLYLSHTLTGTEQVIQN